MQQLAWWFSYSPALVPKDTGTALNFDTTAAAVLADFPLTYKHSNLNFRHCNLVQPSSKRAAEASIRNREQAYLHQIKAQTQQQTFLYQIKVQTQH